jgi:hypothetical protein
LARLVTLGLHLSYPAEACADHIVSWQDLLVVTEYVDGQEPAVSGQISKAHVERCAEELDEPAARIVGRLRRYASLFGASVGEELAGV